MLMLLLIPMQMLKWKSQESGYEAKHYEGDVNNSFISWPRCTLNAVLG